MRRESARRWCRAGDGLRLLPGIKELLSALQHRSDVKTGLVTGNLEPIGWAKMQALGIKDLFSQPVFGGFGTDVCSGNWQESWRDRAELIKAADRKANLRAYSTLVLVCLLYAAAGPGIELQCIGAPT